MCMRVQMINCHFFVFFSRQSVAVVFRLIMTEVQTPMEINEKDDNHLDTHMEDIEEEEMMEVDGNFYTLRSRSPAFTSS